MYDRINYVQRMQTRILHITSIVKFQFMTFIQIVNSKFTNINQFQGFPSRN